MIVNFLGRARVKSVIVPYVCPACGEAKQELFETRALAARPQQACPKCKAQMIEDFLPEAFYSGLSG
jgi:predicted Zn-ribbon and HTH transcriptional regulator